MGLSQPWFMAETELGETIAVNNRGHQSLSPPCRLFIDLPLEPSHFILGVLPAELEENSLRYLLRVLLLIPNKVITAPWPKPQPPTIIQWRERIRHVYNMERTTELLQLKKDIFLIDGHPLPYIFI